MQTAGAVRFEKGGVYTRAEIQGAVGGSRRAALPTRGGKVVCACLTREKNPRAPEEIVIGSGARAVRLARELAAGGAAVPVFVRTRRAGWEYAGARRVRAVVEERGALLALIAEGAPLDVTLALLLEEAPASGGVAPVECGAPVAAAAPASATGEGG